MACSLWKLLYCVKSKFVIVYLYFAVFNYLHLLKYSSIYLIVYLD